MSMKAAAIQLHHAKVEAETNLKQAEESVVQWRSALDTANAAFDAVKPFLTKDDLDFGDVVPHKKTGAKPSGRPTKSDVPATDFAFWLSHITKEKQKTPEILKSAVAALGLTDPAKIDVLKPRMAAFLQGAAKEGKISADGQRFDRVYWLPA